jgi:hypothetical protein
MSADYLSPFVRRFVLPLPRSARFLAIHILMGVGLLVELWDDARSEVREWSDVHAQAMDDLDAASRADGQDAGGSSA